MNYETTEYREENEDVIDFNFDNSYFDGKHDHDISFHTDDKNSFDNKDNIQKPTNNQNKNQNTKDKNKYKYNSDVIDYENINIEFLNEINNNKPSTEQSEKDKSSRFKSENNYESNVMDTNECLIQIPKVGKESHVLETIIELNADKSPSRMPPLFKNSDFEKKGSKRSILKLEGKINNKLNELNTEEKTPFRNSDTPGSEQVSPQIKAYDKNLHNLCSKLNYSLKSNGGDTDTNDKSLKDTENQLEKKKVKILDYDNNDDLKEKVTELIHRKDTPKIINNISLYNLNTHEIDYLDMLHYLKTYYFN